MCPMRFLLVFFSAILAGYFAWKSVRSSPETEFGDDSIAEDISSSKDKQGYSLIEMGRNGFWGFVDMASGRYLWRNLREMKNNENVKSN